MTTLGTGPCPAECRTVPCGVPDRALRSAGPCPAECRTVPGRGRTVPGRCLAIPRLVAHRRSEAAGQHRRSENVRGRKYYRFKFMNWLTMSITMEVRTGVDSYHDP